MCAVHTDSNLKVTIYYSTPRLSVFFSTLLWHEMKTGEREKKKIAFELLKSLILRSSIHRKLALTSLLVYVGLFWTTSGEKWMCAINKSSGWGPAPAWLLVNGTLLWRQITRWLGFQ